MHLLKKKETLILRGYSKKKNNEAQKIAKIWKSDRDLNNTKNKKKCQNL